jgi:AcrR family transcriptional regulator
MKALAIYSAVSQSLLHDHFGSKDKLYEAVMRERSKLIVTHYRLTPVASFRGRKFQILRDDIVSDIYRGG